MFQDYKQYLTKFGRDELDILDKNCLKYLDGRLPDIDYNKMKMKNLNELNADKILMEYEVGFYFYILNKTNSFSTLLNNVFNFCFKIIKLFYFFIFLLF